MKTCSKCKTEKPFYDFHKAAKEKSGLASSCKECVKKYREENRQFIALRSKEYRERNAERLKEARKKKYWDNRELNIEKTKQWQVENKDKYLKRFKKWYANNNDRLKTYSRKRATKMREELGRPYLRSLAVQAGFNNEQINGYPEILEFIKANILLQRAIENGKQKHQEHQSINC